MNDEQLNTGLERMKHINEKRNEHKKKTFEKAKVCMEDQGHSGMSWSLVCAMIKEFCEHGEKFVMWLNKK